jgi:hypothetical protein
LKKKKEKNAKEIHPHMKTEKMLQNQNKSRKHNKNMLPDVIVAEIFSYLSQFCKVTTIVQVNKYFRRILQTHKKAWPFLKFWRSISDITNLRQNFPILKSAFPDTRHIQYQCFLVEKKEASCCRCNSFFGIQGLVQDQKQKRNLKVKKVQLVDFYLGISFFQNIKHCLTPQHLPLPQSIDEKINEKKMDGVFWIHNPATWALNEYRAAVMQSLLDNKENQNKWIKYPDGFGLDTHGFARYFTLPRISDMVSMTWISSNVSSNDRLIHLPVFTDTGEENYIPISSAETFRDALSSILFPGVFLWKRGTHWYFAYLETPENFFVKK